MSPCWSQFVSSHRPSGPVPKVLHASALQVHARGFPEIGNCLRYTTVRDCSRQGLKALRKINGAS